ncbi:hypothetical protein C8P66_10391 [Humitalea rosea]|uniref:Uncharacterized protein n=1 Tax=Humitalea rosea TaxID=990373 RepID=A0A2W7JA96_9PROT|nr:DUF6065 family protein [Humitalea rosea]PZW49065.1 hypothetical protein C8P66_10391 [Humitalea rosea]
MSQPTPPVRFHALLPGQRPPARADRSGLGTLPIRAWRYCEAATTAAGLGWHLFPPTCLRLMWDGERIWWQCDTVNEDWMALDDAAQFPGFSDVFDAAAPPALQGFSPPLLTALPESGVVQLWTGLMAQSAPGWSLLLRRPPNLPPAPGLDAFEGLVETDAWFGPLFLNLRLTRTNEVVTLRPEWPIALAQPVPRPAYAEAWLNGAQMVEGFSEMDWAGYDAAVGVPAREAEHRPGHYAIAARKRRRAEDARSCPFHHAARLGLAAVTSAPAP